MYAVFAIENGKVKASDVFDDMGQALDLAARLKARGQLPKVFQEMEGEVVLTAKIVQNGHANGGNGTVHPIRQAATVREPGAKRTALDLSKLRTRVVSWVVTNPWKGVEEMAKALNVSTKELVLPIRQLLEEGKIKKKGQARAVKYGAATAPAKPVKAKKAA